MPDINRDVSIEQVDYTIDVNNIEYSIEINPQQTFELQLNEQGPQGLTGPQGETGATGQDGFSPIASVTPTATGATLTVTDAQGTTTANILNGIDGVDGQAATISIGSVSTGAAGTSASVINSGTSSAAVFDFTIPKGDKGDTGNTGATGISVTGVSLISTVGLVKTYRMSFSDGSYFDYTVTDGASGSTTWGGITGSISNQTDLSNELTNLQTQIDAIVSSSDVFDIVGTYAELQAYDITTVPVNDIIKVLVDSTHGGAATYYRCTESGGVKSWAYIGSEGAYYTKGEADSLFALISDIPGLATTLQAGIVRPDGVTITIDSNGIISAAPATVIDNLSITENSSDELQTIGVIDQNNTSNAIKTWTGTKAQYDAIVTKDSNTLYWLTDVKIIYLGGNPVGNFKGGRNIGEIISSTLPLTDAGLHLLDGSLIQGSGIYSAFVTYIAGLVNDYPDCFETEANWQSAVTTYGVCGKFVYDSVNNTVRLPKVTGIIEGTTDLTAIGDLIEAGLPNITGNFAPRGDTGGGSCGVIYANGAFALGGATSVRTQGSQVIHAAHSATFDASRSSSIYGNSTTVQPQTIKVLYYIVVATSTKTDIQVDIDEIATDLNGKADVDLTNVNNSGTSRGAGWAMPSSRYINLTVGASGTQYTAPANGWVKVQGVLTANNAGITLGNITTGFGWHIEQTPNGWHPQLILPVSKGDIFTVTTWGNITIQEVTFFYAVGSESEAQ